jgi:hypothetical protein
MQRRVINEIYIDGEFVTPHGTELADLFNPAAGRVAGQAQYVSLGVAGAITPWDSDGFFVSNEPATVLVGA